MTFHLVGRTGHTRLALGWLTLVSLLFCAWHSLWSLFTYLLSILANYAIGRRLIAVRQFPGRERMVWLGVGIMTNALLLLGLRALPGVLNPASASLSVLAFAVPLGLSFLTFQQIAYLIDTYRGEAGEVSWLDYALFITFFPKLSAGPIVRAREFFPQLSDPRLGRISAAALAGGISIFTLGLFKKVALADGLARFVDPVFQEAATGMHVPFWRAWEGTLAYTFQLYFDFSGYTDMAIGIAMMFGLRLPVNFQLPYGSVSIREFWRRWHMTFSRFLRDYLYIPLGGSRRGFARTLLNLMITMVLGGLWHGMTATFLMWGVLHGAYLSANHAWSRFNLRLPDRLGWLATFIAVACAWVWFRADNVTAALGITSGLVNLEGVLPDHLISGEWLLGLAPMYEYRYFSTAFRVPWLTVAFLSRELRLMDVVLSEPVQALAWLALSSFIVFRCPKMCEPTAVAHFDSAPVFMARRALLLGVLVFLILMSSTSGETLRFVYFQF